MVIGTLRNGAAFSFHLEGAKHNNSGVALDITGFEGDLVVTNQSAFGDVREDYVLRGAWADRLPLKHMQVPHYDHVLKRSTLPSSVIELGYLYAAIALDIQTGSSFSPTFDDGVYMHRLIDASSRSGRRVNAP